MLPCHKTHCSSSHHILLSASLFLPLSLSLPPPLLLSGTRGGRCFSHFSLPSSTTEKAARVQLHLGPDMESLNSLKNECLNGIILVCVPVSFLCLLMNVWNIWGDWELHYFEPAAKQCRASLSRSVHRLALESINGGQGCHNTPPAPPHPPPPLKHVASSFGSESFQIHHPAFEGDTPIHNHPPCSLCLFSAMLEERNDWFNS